MSCGAICQYEQSARDARSHGPVQGEEQIYRGSYSPRHYTGGKLRGSFLQNSALLKGELSVWRAGGKHETSREEVTAILEQAAGGQTLEQLHSASASDIRQLTNQAGNRLFCVVDDVETDDQGGFHPAHAHIRLCDLIRDKITGAEDTEFLAAKEALRQLFVQGSASVR